MDKTLCGKTPCPGICSRVCYCGAGLHRSHILGRKARERRERLHRIGKAHDAQMKRQYAMWLVPVLPLLFCLLLAVVTFTGLLVYGQSLRPEYPPPIVHTPAYWE